MPAAPDGRVRTPRRDGRTFVRMPLLLLFVAFIVVPLVELAVIGQVNDLLGLPLTILLLVVDSAAGAWLVRREGSKAWAAFRDALADGKVPGDELMEGVMLLFGGALLLTPGFVTDGVGLALVLPFTRGPIAKLVRMRFTPVPLQAGAAAWNIRRTSSVRDEADADAAGNGVEVLSVERDEPPQLDD